MNQELQIGGHGFDSGLSQSRETDSRWMKNRLPHQQQTSRIQSWDSGIWDWNPPGLKSAHTPNDTQTLIGHKHTSQAMTCRSMALLSSSLCHLPICSGDPPFQCRPVLSKAHFCLRARWLMMAGTEFGAMCGGLLRSSHQPTEWFLS